MIDAESLRRHGRMWGVERLPNETDDAFARRILAVLRQRPN